MAVTYTWSILSVENSIAAQIAEQKSPTYGSGKPW